MRPTWKTRLAWYAGAFVVGAVPFALVFWGQARNFPYLGYLPWIAAAGVIALRVRRGRSVAVFSCLVGLATPYLMLMSFLLGGPVVEEWWHETAFDPVAWRSQADAGEPFTMWPPRLCMVDDLIASRRLDGLTRAEVVALLGEPRANDAIGDIDYYLGPERGLIRIDTESLVIDFDAKGMVASYRIFRD